MTWLTWRQHRGMLGAFVVLFAAIALFCLIDGLVLRRTFTDAHLTDCVGATDPGCATRVGYFLKYDTTTIAQLAAPLIGLCAGAQGAFLGAPLVAAEFERGTHQWVWTQRISRTRWLATKLGWLAAAIALTAAGLGAAYRWWDAPRATFAGDLAPWLGFDTLPAMLALYSVFGFAVGVLASTFLRRTVAAIAVTLAVFLVVRISITIGMRPHYLTPVAVVTQPGGTGPAGNDWDLHTQWVDASGHVLSGDEVNQIFTSAGNPTTAASLAQMMRHHHLHWVDLVQPHQRLGVFQLIETGIYLTLTAACVATAFWRIRKHIL